MNKFFKIMALALLTVGMMSCSKDEEKPASGSNPQQTIPEGALAGKFTVDAEGNQVMFSQGNLQWRAIDDHAVAGGTTKPGQWRFAPKQWDTIGAANHNISQSYSGWIDLFGFSTSGYKSKSPYMTVAQPGQYVGDENDGNLAGTNYDWGVYNAITNGGNTPGKWRTLTHAEWQYLLKTRTTESGYRYAKARVAGVCGLVLLPDNWNTTTYPLTNANIQDAAYEANAIQSSIWTNTLEPAGCVFLPAAGMRFITESDVDNATTISGVGTGGWYWSATNSTGDGAVYATFSSNSVNVTTNLRYAGFSVRLVCDVQ